MDPNVNIIWQQGQRTPLVPPHAAVLLDGPTTQTTALSCCDVKSGNDVLCAPLHPLVLLYELPQARACRGPGTASHADRHSSDGVRTPKLSLRIPYLLWLRKTPTNSCLAGNMHSRSTVKAVRLWLPGALLLAIGIKAAAAVQCNVYEPCPGIAETGASAPQCRREPGTSTTVAPALRQQLPVDMRLPCQASGECHQNVDVVPFPQPPRGQDKSSCSHELMPWSPFPCTYNTNNSQGIPGQPTNLCYNTPTTPGGSLARNLTTDGYNNIYLGSLPSAFCSQGSRAVKMLLTLDFRLAAGRQFDRTYSFQIGRAVAAFGTCSEPSFSKGSKYWSVTVDVTYLQAYMQPGMPTRFSLANLLSNTYNVPIWAKATLNVYYQKTAPSQPVVFRSSTPSKTLGDDVIAFSKQDIVDNLKQADTKLPADVPTEVIPLTKPDAGYESLVPVAGNGSSPANWPNVTFQLPASLSEGRTVYRAQLLVVPKANGCEEFWAMNPPASQTNSTCGGVSTGEPYREVRVYVDGQLAGFYPIYYTMYTGGVDPRLWTAIVASHAYSLPVYRFDLGPWLGLINTPVKPGSDPPDLGDRSHTITVEILGATGSDWILANTLLIWRSSDPDQIVTAANEPQTVVPSDLSGQVISKCEGVNVADSGSCRTAIPARILTAETLLKLGPTYRTAFVRYELSHYSNVITYNNAANTASWNQQTRHSATWYMGLEDPTRTSTQQQMRMPSLEEAQMQRPSSSARSTKPRQSQGSRRSQMRGPATATANPEQHGARPAVLWDGTGALNASGQDILTQNSRQYDWANLGGLYTNAPFVISFNEALVNPTVYASLSKLQTSDSVVITGGTKHYQRALLAKVFNATQPACPTLADPTHTVVMSSSIHASGSGGSSSAGMVADNLCESWSAACAFCAPGLLKNDLNVGECPKL